MFLLGFRFKAFFVRIKSEGIHKNVRRNRLVTYPTNVGRLVHGSTVGAGFGVSSSSIECWILRSSSRIRSIRSISSLMFLGGSLGSDMAAG